MLLVKDGDDILITSESRERSCGYDFCADLCFLFLSTIICRPPKYDGPGNLILLEWWYLDDHFKSLDLLWIRPYGLQVPECSPTQEISTGLSIYKHRETTTTFVCVDLSFFSFIEKRFSRMSHPPLLNSIRHCGKTTSWIFQKVVYFHIGGIINLPTKTCNKQHIAWKAKQAYLCGFNVSAGTP